MNPRIPDQSGRTAIVTGGSSGIGRAAAAALASAGARVILAVRDQERGQAVAERLPGDVRSRRLDLGSLASVHEFADGTDEPVDLLINNAGTMTATRQLTADGFERQFGVNHLGHFALTNLLLPHITGRVVTISSSAHASAHLDLDDLQWERRPYAPFGAYRQSKLANLLFTAHLQKQLAESGSPVLATAAHPGWTATGFTIRTGNQALDAATAIATRVFAQGPEAGARHTLHAALGNVAPGGFTGPPLFGVRGAPAPAKTSDQANDPALAARLWHESESLTRTRLR